MWDIESCNDYSSAAGRTNLFETIETIKRILENIDKTKIQYKNLSELCKKPASVEGLTLRAVNYSTPKVQSHNPGANEDLIISMIDSGRIRKEERTEHASLVYELKQVEREIDNAKRLTAAIKELPYEHQAVLQDTYIIKFDNSDLKALYKRKYKKCLEEALIALLAKVDNG